VALDGEEIYYLIPSSSHYVMTAIMWVARR
jgi:hypothetical protein